MRSDVPRIVFPLVMGLAIAGFSLRSAQAAPGKLFVIPDSDGYGVSECLTGSTGCGKVVADSWCEAHGQGAALAWGKAEDITASIGDADQAKAVTANSVVVRCGA